ncbi:MAG: hypothetical protein QOG26_1196 [Solirubrobacterales bacterium]|jgi:hypothetical protein|nr:hypothetical protein [Solirubrobacterales bacterium]
MDSHATPSVIVAALIGFLTGGVVARTIQDVGGILVVTGAVGGFIGGGLAVITGWDPTRGAAAGGLAGLLVGVLVFVADLLIGG